MFEQSCVLNTCVFHAPNTGMAFLQLLALHVLYAHVHTFSYVRITCYAHVNTVCYVRSSLRAHHLWKRARITCHAHMHTSRYLCSSLLRSQPRICRHMCCSHVLTFRYVCATCSAHMHTSRYVKCVTCCVRTCTHTYHGELGVRPFVARHWAKVFNVTELVGDWGRSLED
jgi:hypothetical protein